MEASSLAVSRMSGHDIERAAADLRAVFQIEPTKTVQMSRLIEIVLPQVLGDDYHWEIFLDEDKPGLAGLSALGEYAIYLSEKTYIGLCNGDPEARMVAAHEFGHMVLHSTQTQALPKRIHDDERVDPEWQADRFAEAWLMPREGVMLCRSSRHVAAKFNVPDVIATRRFLDVKLSEQIQGELF